MQNALCGHKIRHKIGHPSPEEKNDLAVSLVGEGRKDIEIVFTFAVRIPILVFLFVN